nr:MAG TPA: Protein of unknown function (DUF2612) [Caudoviricetes sp.]
MAVSRRILWETVRGHVLEQYRSSQNLLGMIRAAVGEAMQPAEDAAFALQGIADIGTASGEWLDVLGKIVGSARQSGETDDDYRVRLLALAKVNNAGTPDNVISNASDLSGDPAPQYTDECPATFFVYTPGGRQLLRKQVRRLAPAGVLGLPGAALSASDGAFLATADGKKILAAARDEDREGA